MSIADKKHPHHYSKTNIERIAGVELTDAEYQKVLTWLYDKNNRYAFFNVDKYVWELKVKAEKAKNKRRKS